MLKYHGLVARAQFGVYAEDGTLIDLATSQTEVPIFTAEQFENLIAEAKAEAERMNSEAPTLSVMDPEEA